MGNWFFDLIIISFLLLVVVFVIYLNKKEDSTIPKWGITVLSLIAIAAWCVVFYGSFLEPQFITINHQTHNIHPEPTNTIRLALLSDTHLGPYKDEIFVLDIVDEIIKLDPDAILIMGDFVYKNPTDVYGLAPFANITTVYPTYAVTGNHEYDLPNSTKEPTLSIARHIKTALQEMGIIMLDNEAVLLREDHLWLAGVEEVWSHTDDLPKALEKISSSAEHIILMAHNLEIIRKILPEQNIDLLLTAHTHGGQIRLPLIGPIGIIPSSLGQKYDQGWFEEEAAPMFITSGIGESGPRARLFNRPEIVLLEINY